MNSLKIILIILFLAVNLFSQQFDLIPNKPPNEIRILKLKIVADQGHQGYIPKWQKEMTNIIEIASPLLERQVGIKLEISEFESWQRDAKGYKDYDISLTELSKDFPRTENTNFDVVIGLTSHYLEKDQACAWKYPGYIIITNKSYHYKLDKYEDIETQSYPLLYSSERKRLFPAVILHELGHIFGCSDFAKEDVSKKDFVMFKRNNRSMLFCKENIKIIKKYKWRKFPIVSEEERNEKNKISLY